MAFDLLRIQRLHKSITIQDALDTIREARCLPKKYLVSEGNNKTITVQDIALDNKQIAKLFDALKRNAARIS